MDINTTSETRFTGDGQLVHHLRLHNVDVQNVSSTYYLSVWMHVVDGRASQHRVVVQEDARSHCARCMLTGALGSALPRHVRHEGLLRRVGVGMFSNRIEPILPWGDVLGE